MAKSAPQENVVVDPFRNHASDFAGLNFDLAVAEVQDQQGDLEVVGTAKMTDQQRRKNIGKPVLVIEFHEMSSDKFNKGGKFIRALIAVREDDGSATQYLLDDNSTGIAKELRAFQERTGKNGGVLSRSGLRVSDYQRCHTHEMNLDAESAPAHTRGCEVRPVSTWYLDIS